MLKSEAFMESILLGHAGLVRAEIAENGNTYAKETLQQALELVMSQNNISVLRVLLESRRYTLQDILSVLPSQCSAELLDVILISLSASEEDYAKVLSKLASTSNSEELKNIVDHMIFKVHHNPGMQSRLTDVVCEDTLTDEELVEANRLALEICRHLSAGVRLSLPYKNILAALQWAESNL